MPQSQLDRQLNRTSPSTSGWLSAAAMAGAAVISFWNLSGGGNDLWGATADILADAFGVPRPRPGTGGAIEGRDQGGED